MPNSRLVIFDFCGTLISFQTADRYVSFCVKRLQNNRSVQRRHRILTLLDSLRFFKFYYYICHTNNWRKRVVLWQLRGVSYKQCDQLAELYFEEELLPNIIVPTVDALKKHLSQKDKVVILSGGYDIYIRYFAKYFGVKEIICSKIAFEDDKCIGKMDGKDCMRANKKEYIRPLLDGTPTICYTDSKSDLPLLQMVDKPIVVSKHKSQQWATERNYQQIIWN